jgi:hypothetical protein
MRDLLDAEVVQRIAQVLGGVASLSARLLEKQIEVLFKGKNAAVLDEVGDDVRANPLQKTLGLHLIFLF